MGGKPSKEVEVRKLQVTGGSTYVLSLPKSWVIRNQLRKGSSLFVREEENDSLAILTPELAKPEKTEEAFIEVSSKDNPDSVIRKTVSAYLVGYSIIHIRSKGDQQLSSRQRNMLKSFARHLLIGTEIVTDTATELTLQVLLSYPELSVLSALRRMAIITSSMHKDAITALKSLDEQLAEAVIATDDEVDRFHLYIIRQLKTAVENPRIIREIGLDNARECLGYRLVTKAVERSADHAANIARGVLLLKAPVEVKVLRKIEQMSELAISAFELTMESLFKKNFNQAEEVILKSKGFVSLEKETEKSFERKEIEKIVNLRLLIESLRRTVEYASDIAEIVLNLTIESVISEG
jgi:phosphate uptake regulator